MRYVVLFFFILVSVVGNARQVSLELAKSVADEILGVESVAVSDANGVVKSQAKNRAQDVNRAFYVFNAEEDKGFVIVAGDDRSEKVLAYSSIGNFDFDKIPSQLSEILRRYCETMADISDDVPQNPTWEMSSKVLNDSKLLETVNWGQSYPYNLECPDLGGQKAPTGCIATATAIIMKYHNWPESGTRSHKTVSYEGTPTTIDFSEMSFDWNLMGRLYENGLVNETAAMEVSKLMHAIGMALDTQYDAGGSMANDGLLGRYMYEYFRYSISAQTLYARNFTEEEWIGMMRKEIDEGRPFVYGGHEDKYMAGHSFVCDGYDGDMFHINWGWDGDFNGYYSLKTLMGYTENQNMVIGISPRYDDDEFNRYSEMFVDKAYNFGANHMYGICGLNMSVTDIVPGQPFTVSLAQVESIDKIYSCAIGLALTDKNGAVKTFLKPYAKSSASDAPEGAIWFHYNDYLNEYNNFSSTNFPNTEVFTEYQDIFPTDRIQVVSRRITDPGEDGMVVDYSYIEPDWKIVAGTLEAPTNRPVKNNIPVGLHVEWDVSPDVEIWPLNGRGNLDFVLANNELHVQVGHGHGICRVLFNGKYENCYPNSHGSEIQIYHNCNPLAVKVEYDRLEDLSKVEVDMTSPGTLSDRLSAYNLEKIADLTVRGSIDVRDLDFIRESVPYLDRLDLSESSICAYGDCPANAIPDRRPLIGGTILSETMTNLLLPETLEYIGLTAIYCRELRAIKLPKALRKIDGMFVNFLYQTNAINSLTLRSVYASSPVPFELDEGGINITTHGRIDMDSYPTTLIVPEGSKHLYENATGWKDFDEIREMENPAVFSEVVNGVRYVGIGDEALVSSSYFFDLPEHVSIENDIEVDGRKIPVTSVAAGGNAAFNGIFGRKTGRMKHFSINENMRDLPFTSMKFTATEDIYAMNVAVLNTSFRDMACDRINRYSPRVFSPYLYRNIDDLGSDCVFYYPGAFPDVEFYGKEMWEYKIDRSLGCLAVIPVYEGLKIDEVIINGKSTGGDCVIFDVDMGEPLDVVLNYTINGVQDMTTHYDCSFNQSLPESDLSGVGNVSVSSDNDIEIFNLGGIRLYKGLKSFKPALSSGIYIEREYSGSVRKIIVD